MRSYLKSPIINLVVGSGSEQTSQYAHQALLTQSPYFASQCEQLPANARNIDLSGDDIFAASCVLEYLYKGDYFPTLSGQTSLEYDATVPAEDHEGIGLLRHARVYTLAQRFGLPGLASLAHKKIHLTQSTAKGEIAYARFVYKETSPDDEAIRKPVAQFWATRSHVLRHEAEQEFKRMCLEYPQFGFDVLSLVLDHKEQSDGGSGGVSQMATVGVPVTDTPTTGRGRKRARGAL